MKRFRLRLRILPVIVFTAIVFLMVGVHSYTLDVNEVPNLPFNNSELLWDTFSYVKSSAILAISIWAALTMAYLLIIGQMKIKKTLLYVPMIVYVVGVIVSYLMSDYRGVALTGSVERFEGTRTILCYMFMLFYTINVVDDIRDVMTIVSVTLAGVFLACLIGITQLLGHDILLTDTVVHFITGGDSDIYIEGIFQPGQVYQTVANMNYVPMYLALIVPIILYFLYYLGKRSNRLALVSSGINDRKRIALVILLGALLLLIILNVYGSGSLGGILGICYAVVILLTLLLDKKWITLASLLLAAVVAVGAILIVYSMEVDSSEHTGHRQLDYIETGMDRVSLSIDGKELRINYDRLDGGYNLCDSDGKMIGIFCFDGEDGIYQVDDEHFCGKLVLVPFDDENGEASILVSIKDINDKDFVFTFFEEGAQYINPYNQAVSLGKVSSVGFEGHLSSGSGRAFIWSRTIPLLEDRLLIGSGADTFMYIFPQDDYAGRYTSATHLDTICDKAHSIYLNMTVCTGGISLLAFISLLVMSMWKAFHLDRDRIFVKAMAAGIIGFLIAGIFYDSNVCVMPMFYGLLGSVIAESI